MVGVWVGVCVGVAVKVVVVDGVGVLVGVLVGVADGGISGHSKVAVQRVPSNGAVTTIVTVDGKALVLLNDIVPEAGPETFG